MKKLLKSVSALALAGVMAFSSMSFAMAEETQGSADVSGVEDEAASKELSVSVDAGAWKYGSYGTWKNLNIKVNDTMTALSKDAATNSTFHDGDTVKILAGDSYELYTGTVSVYDDGDVYFDSDSKEYELEYTNGAVTLKYISLAWGGGIGGNVAGGYYNYDFTAKADDGTPLSGISVTDNTAGTENYGGLFETGDYTLNTPKEHTWGTGNSYTYNHTWDGQHEDWLGVLTCTTDKTGFTNMRVPVQNWYNSNVSDLFVSENLSLSAYSAGNVYIYVGNGLIDIDTTTVGSDGEKLNNTLDSFGVSTSFEPAGTNEVLGDYYFDGLVGTREDTVILKDSFGNEIGTVTMSVDSSNFYMPIDDKHGILDFDNLDAVIPKTTIKMADGVTDWKVSAEYEDIENGTGTFHITATKTNKTDIHEPDNTTPTPSPSTNNDNSNITTQPSPAKTVTLTSENLSVSKDDMAVLISENVTKDVVIKSNNNVTFTFAKGTMQAVDGRESYNFSTTIHTAYKSDMPSYITPDNFVSRIDYHYSGKLPAQASIHFPVGTKYAGKTLYYYLMNEDNTFAEVQSVTVDAWGFITVKQNHCSSYVVTTEKPTPQDKPTDTNAGKAPISKASVAKVKDAVYTGKAVRPSVKVTYRTETLTENKDYKVSYRSNKEIGKATIIITGIGKYQGTKTVSFQIRPNTVASLKAKSASAGKVKASWKKTAGKISGYEVVYSTNKSLKKAKKKTVKNASVTLQSLKSQKTYYVKVRAYKNAGGKKIYGSYSKMVKVRVK